MADMSFILCAGCFALGFIIAYFIKSEISAQKLNAAQDEVDRLLGDAKRRSENLLKEARLEAKDRLFKMKAEFDVKTAEIKNELKRKEDRLIVKSENLDKRHGQIEKREMDVSWREKNISKNEEVLDKKCKKFKHLIDEQKIKLENISGLTSEQAKELLLSTLENEVRYEGAKLINKITGEAKEEADKKSKKIIATAIQRYAGDFVAERTVSVVHLPNDEMKGRIIGREGRNIRAIEAATGIDLIIDDTPEAVILSGFSPVRREIARMSLTKLIADGRIHPARIEDIVKSAELEVGQAVKEAGEQAAFELGVHGIHAELIKVLGQLKYRTSYAQNVLQHSIEVAFLTGIMASELGLNEKIAKRMGLLHDIGKAIDHEVEGSHAEIGAKLAKKYGESDQIVHAIAAHHEDVVPESVYDLLVQAADSLSGARPGARKELLENYVKRLEDLEEIANKFTGVSNSYAIQAGRELRVIVEGEKISDNDSVLLSRDIAREIEESLTFPGQIKVVVIREMRAVEYANK